MFHQSLSHHFTRKPLKAASQAQTLFTSTQPQIPTYGLRYLPVTFQQRLLHPNSSNMALRLHSRRLLSACLSSGYRHIISRPFSASKDSGEAKDEAIAEHASDSATSKPSESSSASSAPSSPKASDTSSPTDWEIEPDFTVKNFSELPHPNFGVNQHIKIDDAFKETLKEIPWQFKGSIKYAFAYGSGVFPQSRDTEAVRPSSATSIHPKAPPAVKAAQGGTPKMIDFIFGVNFTEHFHSLNLKQHRDHYSALGSIGSGAVTRVQGWGAGVYFNPFVTVNGLTIKYGVVDIKTLCEDLSQWNTLYIAGRLHKPVKILRDDAKVRLANQVNLMAAVRTALLLLPPTFTERELYGTIASISYMGDPRMSLPTEDPSKVANIVGNNLPNFRRLYSPLIDNLPNVHFNDLKCSSPEWMADPTANVGLVQDMDPVRRGNMVRRLPPAFRSKLYFQYQSKYQIPQLEFNKMMEGATDEDAIAFKRKEGGSFDRRIANEPYEDLQDKIRGVIKNTIGWPSTVQSAKGLLTGGVGKSWRYMSEKIQKSRAGKQKLAADAEAGSKETEKEP